MSNLIFVYTERQIELLMNLWPGAWQEARDMDRAAGGLAIQE